MTLIENFKPFVGQNCETTTTGTLLYQLGIELSEPLLFGLGEGLGYIFWNMKSMDFPFIGGRIKPDALTKNICQNLNLTLSIKETSSTRKAWQQVVQHLEAGKLTGLKLDSYHLDYFSNKIHFAGHYVTLYGFDKDFAYLVDTQQQGCLVKTSLKSLELARNERGPMSSRNRSYTIGKNEPLPDIDLAIKTAIHHNAQDYLNPPITNIGYKGIKKTAKEIVKWFNRSEDIKGDFQTTAMLMERAGTGGALFRNLYRDFLLESFEKLKMDELKLVHEEFVGIAKLWTRISQLFELAGETEDIKHIHEAAEILLDLSERERISMGKLAIACP